MSKEFKSLDEQVDRLKSLGVDIKNRKNVKSLLIKYNYQNFINGYNDPFFKGYDRGRNYSENTTIKCFKKLFKFDIELGKIFLPKIQELERILSTNIAYFLGEHLYINGIKDGRIFSVEEKRLSSYFRSNYVSSKNDLVELMTKFLSRRSDKLVDKYLKVSGDGIKIIDYNKVPIWTLCLSWTLGDCIDILESLSKPIQNNILNSILSNVSITVYEFVKILRKINALRNRIAHNNVIYNTRFRSEQMMYMNFFIKNNINNKIKSNELRVMDIAKIIDCFLNLTNNKIEVRVLALYKKEIENCSYFSDDAKSYIKTRMNI